VKTALLHHRIEKREVSRAGVAVDVDGYSTALVRHGSSGHLDDTGRNHIAQWFQTGTVRIDRVHPFRRYSLTRKTQATAVQILPQPTSAEPSVSRSHSW